jgi:protein phosphatase methylesterase 1
MSLPPVPLFDAPSPAVSASSVYSFYSSSEIELALHSARSSFDSTELLTPPGYSFSFQCHFSNWNLLSSSSFFLLFLHGGGQTSLSASPLVRSLSTFMSLPLVAVDFRGHGDSGGDAKDISATTLVNDTLAILKLLSSRQSACSLPPVFILGHSLGAAVAVRLADCLFSAADFFTLPKFPVCGLICIDLVEGSAIESLNFIKKAVELRPKSFPSLCSAVEWAIQSGAIKQLKAATLSIPSQLRQEKEADGRLSYRWRTDLLSSISHWEGWFVGLSELALTLHCPKLLLLVSSDRLDKTMLIAQMQGKIQIQLMKDSSHQIMEDRPDECAAIVRDFIHKHQLVKRIQQVEELQRKTQKSNENKQTTDKNSLI